MIYRTVGINKNQKYTKFNSNLFYSFLFIIIISFSTFFYLKIKNEIHNLKTQAIPITNKRINTIQNSIAVEIKNNTNLKRNFIKIKAEELGMVQADYFNIIDVWWNKEK